MGNACKGNLLRLQSCFLVFESFLMFHVKHDVSTTIQLFHVKRWLFLLWVGVVFWVLVFLVGGGCFTWNMEASVAGKYDLASQHIDACDHFLEVWKSKLHGMLFRFVPCWRRWGCQQLNKPHG